MEERKVYLETPAFTGRNVPITELAEALGKDAQFIRLGLQEGIFDFGYAIKSPGKTSWSYFCPDKKVWESTGYFKEGPRKKRRNSNAIEECC